MVSAAHRASYGCASRDSRGIPESGRDRRATTGWVGTASDGKTGQRGDHRLWRTASWGNQGLQSASQGPSASACEPYREAIELGLSRGRNAMVIWQDLVSDYGFASGYQTVKRFVKANVQSMPIPR